MLQFLFLCSSGWLLNTETHSNLRFPSNYYYYYRLEGRPELPFILPSFARSPLDTVANHKVTNLFECGLPLRLPSIRFHRSASEDDRLTDCLWWSLASVLNSQSIDCYVHFELTSLCGFELSVNCWEVVSSTDIPWVAQPLIVQSSYCPRKWIRMQFSYLRCCQFTLFREIYEKPPTLHQ